MTYNLTTVDATNTTLDWMVSINELADKSIGNGFSVVFFIIVFSFSVYYTRNIGKAILISGFSSFFVTGILFLAAGLVDWYLPILYLVLTIIGIIMQTKPDQSV